MPVALLAGEPTYAVGGRTLNRFDLYELCVQSPWTQVRFLAGVHGAHPRVLGDDFCGPASLARAWLERESDVGAIATDLDEVPLAHAFVRMMESTGQGGLMRLALQHASALEAGGHADVICALNFALCELHSRSALLTYFRHSLFRLNAGGVLVCDVYAGPSQFSVGVYEEDVAVSGEVVVYTWEQAEADPFSARVRNAIHFELPGGERIEDAFTYDWRLWSVAELREAMLEAGYSATEVYVDYGEALDEDGTAIVRPVARDGQPAIVPGDEDVIAYVVGRV